MDCMTVNQEQGCEDECEWSDVDYVDYADEITGLGVQNSDEEPNNVTPAEEEKMNSSTVQCSNMTMPAANNIISTAGDQHTTQFVSLSDFQALEAKLDRMQNQWSAGEADSERKFGGLVKHRQEWSEYMESTATQSKNRLPEDITELRNKFYDTHARINDVGKELSDFKRSTTALTSDLVEAIQVMKPLAREHKEITEQIDSDISQLRDGLNCQFSRLNDFEEELKEVKETTIGVGKSLLEAIRIVKPLANEHEGLVKAHEGLSEKLELVQVDLAEIRQSQGERCAEKIQALELGVSRTKEELYRLDKQLAESTKDRIHSPEFLETWKDEVREAIHPLVEDCTDRIEVLEGNTSMNDIDICRLNSQLSDSITDTYNEIKAVATEVSKTQQETLALREQTKEMLETVNSNKDDVKRLDREMDQLNERLFESVVEQVKHADIGRLDREMDQLNERLFESVVEQVKHEDIGRIESQLECLSIRMHGAETTTTGNELELEALDEQTNEALETITRNSKDIKLLNRNLDELSDSVLVTNRTLEWMQADIRESADESKKEDFPELGSSLHQLTLRVDDAEIKQNELAKQQKEIAEAEAAIWQKTTWELQNTVKLIAGELAKLKEQFEIINTCIHNAEMERGRLIRQQRDTQRYAEQIEEALGHCFDEANVKTADLWQHVSKNREHNRKQLADSIAEQKEKLDTFMKKAAAHVEVETEKARKSCSNLFAQSRAGVVAVQEAINALSGLGKNRTVKK
jgi:chromosome segregation ATPase